MLIDGPPTHSKAGVEDDNGSMGIGIDRNKFGLNAWFRDNPWKP